LEKNNSVTGRSNLGPSSSPSPKPLNMESQRSF
jgi:hypothetical protein